ncbi:MAG: hypothetical protein M0Z55_08580 [Peptococcaceae bacterium]|nr:hypothetical protein [Peptococcaceae bacterium]
MKKIILGILVAIIIIVGAYYTYASNLETNPFSIDMSKTVVEDAAPSLLGTHQTYYFHLQNVSNKTVALIGAKVDGYGGISVGPITTQNKVLNDVVIPSSLVGSSTDGKGIICNYNVVIDKPQITNPQRVILTYEYLGIRHQQTVELP